jgi:hypothetical protein
MIGDWALIDNNKRPITSHQSLRSNTLLKIYI